jgi:hypothetical protein
MLKMDYFRVLENCPNRIRANLFFIHRDKHFKCSADLFGNSKTTSSIKVEMFTDIGWVYVVSAEDAGIKFTWSNYQCGHEDKDCIEKARDKALTENITLVKSIFNNLIDSVQQLV